MNSQAQPRGGFQKPKNMGKTISTLLQYVGRSKWLLGLVAVCLALNVGCTVGGSHHAHHAQEGEGPGAEGDQAVIENLGDGLHVVGVAGPPAAAPSAPNPSPGP